MGFWRLDNLHNSRWPHLHSFTCEWRRILQSTKAIRSPVCWSQKCPCNKWVTLHPSNIASNAAQKLFRGCFFWFCDVNTPLLIGLNPRETHRQSQPNPWFWNMERRVQKDMATTKANKHVMHAFPAQTVWECSMEESEPCSKCLTSCHQTSKCRCQCLRFAYAGTRFAYAHILPAWNLRWLTRTTGLLTPHPYNGPLVLHENTGLERGSSAMHSILAGSVCLPCVFYAPNLDIRFLSATRLSVCNRISMSPRSLGPLMTMSNASNPATFV